MNRKQIQLEVCKGMLDQNRRCGGVVLNENEYAVTTNGFSAFVFFKSEVIFDIEKIHLLPVLKLLFADDEKDVELKRTKEFKEYGGKLVEKYVGENLEMFADVAISKQFKHCKLFANSPNDRIIAKDELGRIVGLYMPTRIF